MESKKEKKKHYIVNECYKMIGEIGIHEFSINKLLNKLSMSKGNFYHYFSSQDELFYTMIDVQFGLLNTKYIEPFDANTFEEELQKLFYIYISKEKEIIEYIDIINQLYPLFSNKENVYMFGFMQEYYKYLFDEIESAMQKGIKQGVLKEEVLSMIKPIAATADGMWTHYFMLEGYDLQGEMKNYINFISVHFKQ
jgi:AcrR family transcriptional regulator